MTRPADTLFRMNRLRRFNRTVWTVLFGTLLVRTSYFMSWPFLIILLNTTLDVSPFWVATMLGVSAATAALTGWYIGYLSDKWGKKPIMMLGCLLAVACYGSLVAAFAFWHYFVIMALLGLVRAMVEVVARAILCDALDDAKDRELALNLRYFIVNIGGAIGPLLGLWIGLAFADLLFMMTAAAYLMYCVWIAVLIKSNRTQTTSQPPNFRQMVEVIRYDHIFLLLVLANLMFSIIYSQANATLPQIVTLIDEVWAAKVIVMLTVVNCVTVVALQFPLLRLMEHLALTLRTQIGVGVLLLSQLLFMVMDERSMVMWGVTFFLFSVAEVIVVPTLGVHIDQLAKEGMRGSYFGAGAFADLGSALGPVIGGMIITGFVSDVYFVFTTVLCVVMLMLYGSIARRQKTGIAQ